MKYLLLTLALISCGPAWQLKRAKKLEILAISKGAKVKVDTFYKAIHLHGPSIEFPVLISNDRSVHIIHKDTTIFKDKISYRVIQRHDTIEVEAKCPDVNIKAPVEVKKEISAGVANWWKPVAICLGILLLLMIGFVVLRK